MLFLVNSDVLAHERAARDHAFRFVQAGERRRRGFELQLASAAVATRSGLAPPARIGVPESQLPIWIFPVLLTTKNSCFENYATEKNGWLALSLIRLLCSAPCRRSEKVYL